MIFPKRHKNHTIEEESIIYFRNYLPVEWNINTIDRDYGQDLNIEICENGEYKALEFIVQLKSSFIKSGQSEYETAPMNVSTYNYLWRNLRVVLMVKYVKEENEAYWILLKDVPSPNQNNQTLTISWPKNQRLSTIDWNGIVEYVRNISTKKLAAVEEE